MGQRASLAPHLARLARPSSASPHPKTAAGSLVTSARPKTSSLGNRHKSDDVRLSESEVAERLRRFQPRYPSFRHTPARGAGQRFQPGAQWLEPVEASIDIRQARAQIEAAARNRSLTAHPHTHSPLSPRGWRPDEPSRPQRLSAGSPQPRSRPASASRGPAEHIATNPPAKEPTTRLWTAKEEPPADNPDSTRGERIPRP